MEQIGLSALFDLTAWDKGIDNYLRDVKRAENETQGMAGSLGKAYDSMGKSVLNAATTIGKTFVAATAAAALAVSAFVANGINKAADLESKMGGIASIMGETKDAIEPLKELILDLGMDPTLKVNATEAADAIEKLASNGLTMTQIMDGAAKSTVLLANSTGADFDTAAAVATDTMALFNISAENMQAAVDGITGVTVASKFGINDYRLALAQAGGVASATGVSFDDFNTSITGISNYFASGSDAGTSFKTMLLRLVPSTDAAANMMSQLGLTTFDTQAAMDFLKANGIQPLSSGVGDLKGQLYAAWAATDKAGAASDDAAQKFNEWQKETGLVTNAFYDANGSMRDMSEISVLLNGALKDLSEEEKSKALNTIFGTDAMRAAVGIAEQGEVVYTDLETASKALGVSIEDLAQYAEGGITKFEALQAQIGKTDAVESAKVRMDNFKGSMEILQGVIDTVALKIGFAFLPMLKNMADNLSNFISNHADQIVLFFENFAGAIDAFVTGTPTDFPWEDIFPPWLAVVAYAISELVEGINLALSDFQSGAMGLDYPWEDVFPPWLANTIYFVTQNVDAFTGALGGVAALLASAGIAAAVSGIAAALMGLLSPIVLLVGGAAALGAAWNSNFLGMKDATFAVIDALSKAFLPLTIAVDNFGSDALSEIVNFVTGNKTEFDNLEVVWTGASASVKILFADMVRSVTANLPLWQAQLLEWGNAAWGWIVEASAVAVAKLGEWATALVGALAANLPTIIATLIEWSAALVTWITDAIAGGITMLGTWAAALVGWISGEGKTQIGGGALALVGALIDWIANDLIPKVAPAMGEFSAALASGIVKIAAALGVDAVKIATSIVDAIMKTDYKAIGINILTLIRDGWNATVSAVTTVVTTFVDGIKNKFTEVDWKSIGTAVLTYIKDGFSAVVGTAITVITTFASSIKLKFTEIDWKAIGSSILTFIKDGINAMAPGVLTALGAIVTSLKDKFSDTVNNWTATGKDILDKVRTGIESAKTTTLATITTVVADMRQRYVTPDGFAWSTIGSDISNAIRDGLQTAARAAGGILSAVVDVATFIKDQFTDQSWDEIGKTIVNSIRDGLDAAAKAAGGLLTVVKNMGLDLMRSFTEIDWEEVGRSMARLLKDGFRALAEGAGGLLPTVKNTGQGIVSAFSDIDWLALGRDIVSGILTGVKAIAYGAGGLMYVVSEIVEGFTEELFDVDWQEQGQKIIQNIQAGLEAAKTRFMEVVKSIPTGIKQIFTDMTQEFKNIGAAIVDGIGSGITGAKDALMKKAQDLANALPGWVKEILGISSPSKVFMEIGRNVVEGLIVGVNEMTPKLQSTMQAISSSISGADLLNINFSSSDTFAQRLSEFIEPWQKTADEMEKRRQDLTSFIANLTSTLNSGMLNGTQVAAYVSWIAAARDKLAGMTNTQAEQELATMKSIIASGDEARKRVSFYEDQIALMQEAKKLGIDVTGLGIGDMSPANIIKMANIEKRIAELKREQLFYTAQQLQASTKQIDQYKSVKDAIVHVETYNSHLSDQLAMMKKAESLGLDLSRLWAGGIIRDPNDTGRLLQLQLQIASATGASLENQMNTMIAEQKRVKGLAAAMQQLQPLIDQTNVSSAWGQKYKAEVLDPMLRALEKSAGIDSERVRLMNEYTAAAQRLVEINKKEDQLDFLKQQLDVVKMIQDQDLVGGNSLFDGIAFGVNASIDDLLTLTNRVLNSMITEVKDELGIHSPSQVFADIGSQMMAGLQQGIQRGFMQPLNALRSSIVPHGAMSTRTLNFAMGGVTINTPMDEVMFESRVLRILERSMN